MDALTFDVAAQMADAASTIDYLKNFAPVNERAEFAEQSEKLHDTAQFLAGERVGEIYSPEGEHMHNRNIRAFSRRINDFLFYRSLGYSLAEAWEKASTTI